MIPPHPSTATRSLEVIYDPSVRIDVIVTVSLRNRALSSRHAAGPARSRSQFAQFVAPVLVARNILLRDAHEAIARRFANVFSTARHAPPVAGQVPILAGS